MMRDASGLQYFLTDHLGSTVAITDSNGTLTSQQRYLPFGGTRANVTSPNSPGTDFGYTGQRQLDADMGGLMDYKARFYSPYLNRFIQPDTITPGGPQGLNRYSYVSNNPIRYNDPSGHNAECGLGELGCKNGKYTAQPDQAGSLDRVIASFGITTSGGFDRKEKWAILKGARLVGDKLAEARGDGESAVDAFSAIYTGGINFTKGSANASGDCVGVTSGGCTSSSSQINFWSIAGHGDPFIMMGNVIHELGHAYNNEYGKAPEKSMPFWMYNPSNPGRELFLQPNSLAPRDPTLVCDDCPYWQYNRARTATETFGDMFVAWTLGVWNLNPDNAKQVTAAQIWMNGQIPQP